MSALRTLFRPAAVLLGLMTLLTGLLYPGVVTGAAHLLFPWRANGSLVAGGSELLGRDDRAPDHFWGRPSATLPEPDNALASGASNLGPSNPALRERIEKRVAELRAAHPESRDRPIPIDLVTTSGSGLDPHISPAAARFQLERVARARGLPLERVRELIERRVEQGLWGEPRVNVLLLNRELDRIEPHGRDAR